jgi:hypothetical protein
MTRHHRRGHPSSEDIGPEPRSNVHLLKSEEELQDALRRSAEFDRVIVDKLKERANRYEAMIAPASITQIGIDRDPRLKVRSADQEPANEPHSA